MKASDRQVNQSKGGKEQRFTTVRSGNEATLPCAHANALVNATGDERQERFILMFPWDDNTRRVGEYLYYTLHDMYSYRWADGHLSDKVRHPLHRTGLPYSKDASVSLAYTARHLSSHSYNPRLPGLLQEAMGTSICTDT